MDVIHILGFSDEIECMLSVPPYHRVFMFTEPCYEELITEFYALFEFHYTYVAFQLGVELHRLTMPEFGVALGLWTTEEQMTDVYTTAFLRFYGGYLGLLDAHIPRRCTFLTVQGEGTRLIPVLRYLHTIIAYTITGRLDSQIVVTSTDVGILLHMFRGILVD